MRSLPLSRVYQLLEPGPVVLLTMALLGRANVMTMFLEAMKAWSDPAQKRPKTIHHRGFGRFVVDGATIKLGSRKP